MALPDPSIEQANKPGLGLGQTGPMDFNTPKPAAAPTGGGYTGNPWPAGSARHAKWAAEHPQSSAPQFDEQGYPIPTDEQIKAFDKTLAFDTGAKPGESAYNPQMEPPEPDSDNPNAPGSDAYKQWQARNNKKKYNQEAKAAWQKQHADKRQAQPAAAPQSAAPATPFQSSGVDLTKAGKGESYIDSILSHYGHAGVPQVGNQSKQTLDSFRAQQPADMSKYYDHASKLASAKIDNAMAARGSYGSSNATGQIGAAEVALRAQEARDNASYGLSRFAQEGSLAGAADNQGNVANGIQYQWTKGLGDMAAKSQDLGQGRNQRLWDNNFSLAAAKAGIYGAGAQGAIGGVDAATDAAINAKQGVATDALSNANANANASNGATAGLLNAANQGVSNYTKFNSGKTN
jgi:hypothetical protein